MQKASILQWDFLDCGRLESYFVVILEARGLILEAWRPILRICGIVAKKSSKRALADPPQRQAVTHFLQCCGLAVFFECSRFWFFVILSAQRLHFGFNLNSFLGALGLFKNSWKCVTIINFRGLTPSGESLLAGLDRECVLMLSFCRIVRFWVVWGSPFWALLVPIVVKNQGG